MLRVRLTVTAPPAGRDAPRSESLDVSAVRLTLGVGTVTLRAELMSRAVGAERGYSMSWTAGGDLLADLYAICGPQLGQ